MQLFKLIKKLLFKLKGFLISVPLSQIFVGNR